MLLKCSDYVIPSANVKKLLHLFSLPLPVQNLLMETLLSISFENNAVRSLKSLLENEDVQLATMQPHSIFAISIYARWILKALFTHHTVSKPSRSSNINL